jgi:probable F420-dependent oxidoreductase
MSAVPYGVALPNYGPLATPEDLLRLARHAEALGIDSIWVSDHIVVPEQIGSVYPYDRTSRSRPANLQNLEHCFDALSTLAFLAGATTRIRLGVSVYVVPLRNPILTAKMVASIDALSQGRMIFGCGVGWLREEFEVMHAPDFASRGAVTDAYLRVCRAMWSEEIVQCDPGDYAAPAFRARPKPEQRPHPPIWIGGNGRAAMARAVRLGNGWHPIDLAPGEITERLQVLHELCVAAGRQPSEITISLRRTARVVDVTPPDAAWLVGDADKVSGDVQVYAAAGVGYLILNLRHGDSVDDLLRQMDCLATALGS